MIYLILLIIIALLLHARYKQGYAWKDIFSPKKWKAVYVWLLKRYLNWLEPNAFLLTDNELLQVAYRVSQCTDCVELGKCKDCGCNISGKMCAKDQACSLNKWGPMLTDEEMNTFRKNYNIQFTAKIEKKDDNI
jgi:hypothetical protein